jgi:hypothetical protein
MRKCYKDLQGYRTIEEYKECMMSYQLKGSCNQVSRLHRLLTWCCRFRWDTVYMH